MTIFQAIVIGLVQAATEFAPVSSSGHLVLVPWLLGWESPGLTLTVVAHLGTVIGMIIFFWRDWLDMFTHTARWVRSGELSNSTKLLWLIVLAVIPAALIGFLFNKPIERAFESPLFAALMLLVTAALLLVSEYVGKLARRLDDMSWQDSLLIGVMQVLAILPGISRSGTTIAAGRLRHINREDAARFSFLLATPLILGAGAFELSQVSASGLASGQWSLVACFLTALISTYFVIRYLLNYLRNHSMRVFALYCVAASALSLIVYAIRLP